MIPTDNYRELLHKFDGTGPGGDQRLAWYGQERAQGLSHDAAIASTYDHFKSWCDVYWPRRDIELPK
jgi:hypothetical protein